MKKDNIILIGMPGCGKSTVGVVLAKVLGYQFVDSDLVIQSRMGKLLHEIIEERGQQGFRQVENDVNASLDAIRTEAQKKAVEGGCFERAAVSCQHQLQTFVGQFRDLSQYRLAFQFRDGIAPEELPAEADDGVEEAQEA